MNTDTHEALKFQAYVKLTRGPGNSTRDRLSHAILPLMSKVYLTAAELAVLEHFVHSSRSVLERTVYFNNEILYPVPKDEKRHTAKKSR